MITEDLSIAYFEKLAREHHLIRHQGTDQIEERAVKRQSFFYLPAEWDMSAIEKQLRSGVASPLMMLDCSEGAINDNGSASVHDDLQLQYTILQEVTAGGEPSIQAARKICKRIGFEIAYRMLHDKRNKQLVLTGKSIHFKLGQIKYDAVGPMENKFYGYTFRAAMSCPLALAVGDGTWLDIPVQ